MFASTGPFVETVELLLDHGANANAVDLGGESWTALMFAAGEGQTAVVRALLAAGADPTLVDADGDAAVEHARAGGHAETAKLLESAGANRD